VRRDALRDAVARKSPRSHELRRTGSGGAHSGPAFAWAADEQRIPLAEPSEGLMLRNRRTSLTPCGGRRGQSGSTLVDVAASGFVLAVSVAGLVVSTVYGRGLERSTGTLWRAAGAATATMEKIRSDATTQWGSLPTAWDGQTCADGGIDDPITSRLAAQVISDATKLDDATGMWSAGATAPNFYFVEITPGSGSDDLSRSLVFQTYVANRTGFAGSVPGSASTAGGATAMTSSGLTTTGDAAKISATAASVTVSGTGQTICSFNLSNSSSTSLRLTDLKLNAPVGVDVSYVSVNGTAVFNNPAKAGPIVTVLNCTTLLPSGIAPGTVAFQVRTVSANLAGRSLTLQLVFADHSTRTATVVTP
jgi:hypothetical protein